jgi:ribose 5-phosphate isomerase A
MKKPHAAEDGRQEQSKREVGYRAAELVREGMTVGLGTGSTARHLIARLGERVQGGLSIRAVATSEETARQARSLGIPLVTLEDSPRLDLAIDGADQVDREGNLIKGLGGALYREKLVARAARVFVVIVDASKLVETLGAGCPVPVEVFPDSVAGVERSLGALGARCRLRARGGEPYRTDNGNPILDAEFGPLEDPRALERAINALPGVLENGIFTGLTSKVLLGEGPIVREVVVRGRPRA